jgi:SAM-dependent methyltransferase
MGRWSALLAPRFLDFCELGDAASCLDVGCGTGVLAKAIRARDPATLVVGIDPAGDFIVRLAAELADGRSWFCRGDAMRLPFADSRFDATLGLLILQHMADPAHVLSEMRRATRPGGTVATAIWDFQNGMPMFSIFWDAMGVVAPAQAAERTANKPTSAPGRSEQSLAALWRAGGLADVRTTTIAVDLEFTGLDDFWTPFLSNATPSSSLVGKLDRQIQAALKAEIRARLFGDRPDGPVRLAARAFAVRGRIPAG